MTTSNSQKIAILDAGAQYGKVIDRRVRELNVESELLPLETPAAELQHYAALIISGGPESVYSPTAPQFDPEIFKLGLPILGICYGMQLLNFVYGGQVKTQSRREDGPCAITITPESKIFAGLKAKQDVLMTHGDTVTEVAAGWSVIADSDGLVAAIENPELKQYGVQFHPEVDLTPNGQAILKNFLYGVAGLKGDFSVEDREATAIAEIQKTVKDHKVLLLLSGGVDSTVCAALVRKALPPEQIMAIHINTGFMRLNESDQVIAALSKIGVEVQCIEAQEAFLNATTIIDGQETLPLSQITDPQQKRKIIGDTFIKVAQSSLQALDLDLDSVFLVQGTLRPDLIESASTTASKKADTIKTHHNDTQLVRELRSRGRVIEPLSEYHKDEVRKLGIELGLPPELVWRQPFPGPGLAIRILCADEPFVTGTFAEIKTKLKSFETDDIKVCVLPVKTVGVQGDGRTYSYVAGLSGKADWETLADLARQIPKLVHQINRVVYIFGEAVSDVPLSITPTHLLPEVITQLQQADAVVNKVLYEHNLIKTLTQVPVVLFPVDFGEVGKRSLAIRTFLTNDFMTGVPAIPGHEMPLTALKEMVEQVLAQDPMLARVVYDLTSKPPGTTEWE